MASGKPSMMALLGLLAVAGFKHKDKLSDMLAGARAGGPSDPAGTSNDAGDRGRASGSLLSELATMFGGGAAGGTLSHGLSELIDRFKESGRSEDAESWVSQGSNRALDQGSLEQTLGEDTLSELAGKTGMSRAELLERLSASIPDAVDTYSPDGRLPTEQEAERYS